MIAGRRMARVVDEPLSVAEHEDAVADQAAGEFVHFYTATVGAVFFEVVQRSGGYDGYGAANAPVLARRLRERLAHLERHQQRELVRLRGERLASRAGIRRLRRARRRGEEAAADLEAAGLHRRRGGVGRLPVTGGMLAL